jgi:hypothetical protein
VVEGEQLVKQRIDVRLMVGLAGAACRACPVVTTLTFFDDSANEEMRTDLVPSEI